MTEFRAIAPEEAARLAKLLTEEFAPNLNEVATHTALHRQVTDHNAREGIATQLDAIGKILSDERHVETLNAQKDTLRFIAGQSLLESKKINWHMPQQVIDFVKDWSDKFPPHTCHMNTCDMINLKRGSFVHPVTGKTYYSNGDFYICSGLFISPESKLVRYGSMRVHQCGSACELIESNTIKPEVQTSNFQQKGDDSGHCPITNMAKHVQRQKTPGFNDAKISAANLGKLTECDRKDYLGVEPEPKRRRLGRKKKVFDVVTPEMRSKFEVIISIITSVASQRRYFRQCVFSKVEEHAVRAVKEELRANPDAPLETRFHIYINRLRNLIPVHMHTPGVPLDKSRYPIIVERVRLVWKTVMESPYVTQNSAKNGQNKRDKPVNPSFDNVCATCIFAMSIAGIFIGYEAVDGTIPRKNFCFLPVDDDIKRVAVPPDKITTVLNVVKKAPNTLDNKTYRETIKVVMMCVSSYVKQYAQDATDDIKAGVPVLEATNNYIRRCEALCID